MIDLALREFRVHSIQRHPVGLNPESPGLLPIILAYQHLVQVGLPLEQGNKKTSHG